jgi:hypothetical protein
MGSECCKNGALAFVTPLVHAPARRAHTTPASTTLIPAELYFSHCPFQTKTQNVVSLGHTTLPGTGLRFDWDRLKSQTEQHDQQSTNSPKPVVFPARNSGRCIVSIIDNVARIVHDLVG